MKRHPKHRATNLMLSIPPVSLVRRQWAFAIAETTALRPIKAQTLPNGIGLHMTPAFTLDHLPILQAILRN
ncbi:hypothetical protein BDQ12DRAFT_682113 [Crucibulum laeve]|uniref:Uncharacterized protein n=1 Tax=Crucibulum laeve TaxID=68775 RepID=A0A5C3M4S6_9AGAR|nr:hypothetical protein BDQ12DRAFT_682113 [Crucibulum laeve]